jgi:hypothetical protein
MGVSFVFCQDVEGLHGVCAPESGELNRWTTSSIVLDMAATITMSHAVTNKTSFDARTERCRGTKGLIAEGCSSRRLQHQKLQLIAGAIAIKADEELD